MAKNFVILIGGPGLFIDCDPRHDKTWLNYVAPMQLAAKDDLYKKDADEKVHWFVFEPPYEHRFIDDSEITLFERVEQFFVDAELHELRKKAADKVKSKGAKSYINRVKHLASNFGIAYHGLRKVDDFWSKLAEFPDGSLSRVWYSGHAAGTGLFLSLSHDRQCAPVSNTIVQTSDISTMQTKIGPKIDSSSTKVSKFYGCGTKHFAEEWHRTFNVPTAGATHSITFAVLARPGSNVLTLIEQTATSQENPEWVMFPSR
jgi:hypothetical protein